MKKLLLASVAVVAICATPAFAADMPVKAPAYKAPAPIWNWTGFYIGFHGGIASSRLNSELADDNLVAETFNSPKWHGSVFGGQAGYNQQLDRLVVGVEGDWSRATGTRSASTSDDGPFADVASAKLRSLASIRGRAGVLLNPQTLVYATGGWGWGKARYLATDVDNAVPTATFGVSDSGGVFGAGLEYMVYPNWTVRAEYLRYALNKVSVDTTVFPGSTVTNTLRSVDVIRFGLNYKLDWGKGPVSAKY